VQILKKHKAADSAPPRSAYAQTGWGVGGLPQTERWDSEFEPRLQCIRWQTRKEQLSGRNCRIGNGIGFVFLAGLRESENSDCVKFRLFFN